MKKLLLAIGILMSFTALAQKEVVSAYNANKDGDFRTAATYIEQAILVEKSAVKDKTWRYRGQIYLNIAADPEVSVEYPNALVLAKESYLKARELDVKERYESEIIEKLDDLKSIASNKGVEYYNLNEFSSAGEHFDLAIEIANEFELIDSVLIYSAALSYKNGGDVDKAINRYIECANINYNLPHAYTEAAQIFVENDQLDNALQLLLEARNKFPNEIAYITAEYNIHLSDDNFENALGCIISATEMDSTNALYWNLRGTIFNDDKNQEIYDVDKALYAYQVGYDLNEHLLAAIDSIDVENNNYTTISLDFDTFFNTNYGLGAVYVGQRVLLQEKYNDLVNKNKLNETAKQRQERDDIKAQMNNCINSAIKHMEIALTFNSTDLDVIVALKQLYGAVDDFEKYNKMKELESSLK